MIEIDLGRHDSFKIGNNITVKISRINGDEVRIAIDAPREINIAREELLKKYDYNSKNLRDKRAKDKQPKTTQESQEK